MMMKKKKIVIEEAVSLVQLLPPISKNNCCNPFKCGFGDGTPLFAYSITTITIITIINQ